MAIEMPKIDVIFQQLAASLIARSQRGIAILVIRDGTDDTWNIKKYASQPEATADSKFFTEKNLQYIKDTTKWAPYLTYVVRIGAEDTLDAALTLIEKNIKTGWITVAAGTADDWAALVSWIKAKEQRQQYYRAAVFKANAPDNKHVVNLSNNTVTFADSRGKVTASEWLPSLIGILACCNIQRGCTNYLCSDLIAVEEVEDNDKAVGEGKFILYNADVDEVRIAQGINSLTTTNGSTLTEDMKFIETVEAMDLIADDIRRTFREEYLGNYRNKLDNQMLFIGAANGYLRDLAKPTTAVLDDEYDNVCQIDVGEKRAAWIAGGKPEAAEWTDDEVRAMAFKRDVFIWCDVKILGSMTNLRFLVNMF